MGVRKYRRIEDLPEPPRSQPGLDGLRAACELSETTAAFGRTFNAPRGVLRFRSVQEADAHRKTWEMPPRTHESS